MLKKITMSCNLSLEFTQKLIEYVAFYFCLASLTESEKIKMLIKLSDKSLSGGLDPPLKKNFLVNYLFKRNINVLREIYLIQQCVAGYEMKVTNSLDVLSLDIPYYLKERKYATSLITRDSIAPSSFVLDKM